MEKWEDFLKQDERINLFKIRKPLIKSPNKEGMRILNSLNFIQFRSYPKNCDTDAQKLEYLKKLWNNNDVEAKVLVELADVLKYDKKKLNVKLGDIIGKKLLNRIREEELKW